MGKGKKKDQANTKDIKNEEKERFQADDVKKVLEPYTSIYENFQGMIFWRRPIPMVILLFIVEFIFLFVEKGEVGFIPVLTVIITFRYLIPLIYKKFGDKISEKLFPPISKGSEDEPNRIYPLEPFCQIVASLGSSLYSFFNKFLYEQNIQGLLVSTAIFLFLMIFFWLFGTTNIIFIIVHLLILGPGIIFHPKLYPYTHKFLEKINKFVCGKRKHPKTE